tara:strand:- start:519 stop:884 length:366 start_codon:yes stop_codon:yes gene_type:complete
MMMRLPNIELPHPNHLEWQEIIDDPDHEFWDSEKFQELRDEIEGEVMQDIEESTWQDVENDDKIMADIGRDALRNDQTGSIMDQMQDIVAERSCDEVVDKCHEMIIEWLENKGKKDIRRFL